VLEPIAEAYRRRECVALSAGGFAEQKPDHLLFPHTYQVRDFAPKLAAMLRHRHDWRLHRLSK